jgi:hypothetical protein
MSDRAALLSNEPPLLEIPDDELLKLFLSSRGELAFRHYVRTVADRNWPAAHTSFVLEALHSRLGQIIRGSPYIDDFLGYKRVLAETLSESGGAPHELRSRLIALERFCIEFVNQEGGAESARIVRDPGARLILNYLFAAGNAASEPELAEMFESAEEFNVALCALLVAGLITATPRHQALGYCLTAKGDRYLKRADKLDPFQELARDPEDLRLWAPVQPIFDLLVIPFAQHLLDRPMHGLAGDIQHLRDFNIKVQTEATERSVDLVWEQDEAFLRPTGRASNEVGAITLPMGSLSPNVKNTSMDILVGNAFCGYHLLISRSALSRAPALDPKSRDRGIPADPAELVSAVPWRDFGRWLKAHKMKALILGDRATRPFFERILQQMRDADGLWTLEDVDSNSGRLARLQAADAEEEPSMSLGDPAAGGEPYRTITLAVATGPLLALAAKADLRVLTTSGSILYHISRELSYTDVSQFAFKQYVHIEISQDAFLAEPRKEDQVYRILAFLEHIYRIIASEPLIFAQFCAEQWQRLSNLFPHKLEFFESLHPEDVRFAVDACYCWLGHRLPDLTPEAEWPNPVTNSTFWTAGEAAKAVWPTVIQRRRALEERLDALEVQANQALGSQDPSALGRLQHWLGRLRGIGCLRQAEAGLVHLLSAVNDGQPSLPTEDSQAPLRRAGLPDER